jgi:hypothetical protein
VNQRIRGGHGLVGADGRSALPAGIVDHSEGHENVALSAEVQARLDRLWKESDLDKLRAKYKLEIAINEERSTIKPYTGLVTAWTNGGFANGGGDESIYFCPSLVEKNGQTKTCSAPIDLKWIGKAAAICPTCRQAVDPKQLCGQVGYKMTTQNWAAVITRMWLGLEGNADIRLGVMVGHLRARTDDVMKKTSLSAGDKLDGTRLQRKWAAYPLKNIIKDTSAGADLQKRIEAFLGQALLSG